jgi:ankyrin repeat protein
VVARHSYPSKSDPLRSLIDRCVAVDERNENQQTPLFLASRGGRLEVAKFLLKAGAESMHLDCLERSSLHGASGNGHYEVTKLLLDKADVDAKDVRRWTPLHMASNTGKHTVVELLLEHEADLKAQNDLNKTSLHIASQEGYPEVVHGYSATVPTPIFQM